MTLATEILYGDLAGITRELQSGVELNDLDEFGYTPLIECGIVNDVDKAKLLIQYGADVNLRDVTGSTPLHWAVDNNNIPLCKLLLESGANPNGYTRASQPVLVKPLLRGQQQLKNLLYRHGADLTFAQDFINAKLIGHRFELFGRADIVNHAGQFVEIDFEGFFLEFTLELIQSSLQQYRSNFAAKHLRHYFNRLAYITHALEIASELIKYQQYTVDVNRYQDHINELIHSTELLLIPVAFEGHAITFVKFGALFAKCDRGEYSKENDSVEIHRITRLEAFNQDLVKRLIYVKSNKKFIEKEIVEFLGLQQVSQLLVGSQLSGNCSWANVEASIPTMLFFLSLAEQEKQDNTTILRCKNSAMSFYRQWCEWDKDIALSYCIQSFRAGDKKRKASKAVILGAILFQRCDYEKEKDIERAQKILSVLGTPEYEYVIKNYIEIYCKKFKSKEGERFLKLLDLCKYRYSI